MDPAALEQLGGGVELARGTRIPGCLVIVEGVAIAAMEPAEEVMALREQAIRDRLEAQDYVEAEYIWIALEGVTGLPCYVDPTKISTVQANRKGGPSGGSSDED